MSVQKKEKMNEGERGDEIEQREDFKRLMTGNLQEKLQVQHKDKRRYAEGKFNLYWWLKTDPKKIEKTWEYPISIERKQV